MEVKETKGGKRREARRGREGGMGVGPTKFGRKSTPDTYGEVR